MYRRKFGNPKRQINSSDCLGVPQPFNAQENTGGPFHKNFNSILRRDHQKNFL